MRRLRTAPRHGGSSRSFSACEGGGGRISDDEMTPLCQLQEATHVLTATPPKCHDRWSLVGRWLVADWSLVGRWALVIHPSSHPSIPHFSGPHTLSFILPPAARPEAPRDSSYGCAGAESVQGHSVTDGEYQR